MSEQILTYLKQKDRTMYWIAKEISKKRTEGKSPASRYHSAISKAVDHPQKSRLETIVDIVEALGGEITINWEGEKKETTRFIYINAPYEIITDSYTPNRYHLPDDR
ncbi:UNVERIFIED_CONTAM: hypothetical protein BEN50_17055 [Euhalothece sp. KZN 001]